MRATIAPARLRGRDLGIWMAAAAVAVPVLVTGIATARGYYPAVDDGIIASRSYDVWTREPPLLGQYSQTPGDAGRAVHSPGPMLYWLVSIPARLGPDWSFPLVMAVVNAALLAGVVLLARRIGGSGFGWAVAWGLVLLVRAFGPAHLVGIWNPWAALVPFVALVFVAWSIARGDRVLLPVGILLASFVMQAHLTYVIASVGLLAVAVAGGWGLARWDRNGGESAADRSRRGWVPWVGAAAVGAACWALPLYQQATTDPGNLTLIARAGGRDVPRAGSDAAWSSLWRSIGLPPGWVRGVDGPTDPLARLGPPSSPALIGTIVIMALVLSVALVAVARRDRVVATGSAVVGALVVGLWFVAVALPLASVIVAGYSFRWFALAGLVAWLVAGLAVTRSSIGSRLARRLERVGPFARIRGATPRARVAGSVVGAALLLVAGLSVGRPDPIRAFDAPARELGRLVIDGTDPGATYLIGRSGRFDLAFTPATMWALRSHGRNVVLADGRGRSIDRRYEPRGRRCDGVVVLAGTADPRVPGGRWLGEVDTSHLEGVLPTMRVDLVPDREPGGSC